MASVRRESWVGTPERFGILQRLGIACSGLSILLVLLAFNAPGSASIRYWLFVAAHALVWIGFVVAAFADRLGDRRFSLGRFVFAGSMAIFYAIVGPVVMAAAAGHG